MTIEEISTPRQKMTIKLAWVILIITIGIVSVVSYFDARQAKDQATSILESMQAVAKQVKQNQKSIEGLDQDLKVKPVDVLKKLDQTRAEVLLKLDEISTVLETLPDRQ